MARVRKIFLLFVFIGFFLSGCKAQGSFASAPRYVTQVDIHCRHGQQTLRRHYTAPEKMSSVLNYIRLLEDGGRPDTDPERITGDVYKITLHLSDGSRRVYHQRANRYLSRDAHPWEKIDPEQAEKLYPILEELESDGVETFIFGGSGFSRLIVCRSKL